MKKEEEERQRAKNEVQLSIPQDHPVRKLFQKFKQQKELRSQGAAAPPRLDPEKNRLQVEQHHPRHQHLHPNSLQLGHASLPLNLQRPAAAASMQNGAPPSSSVLTVSQVTPMPSSLAYSPPGAPPTKQNNCDIMELQPSASGGGGAEQTVRVTVSASPAPPKPVIKASGWMRLKNNAAPVEARREGLNNNVKAVSVEMLSQEGKGQGAGGGGDVEEGGVSGNNPLRKTDSCDSGITKSDLRLDNAGEARTPAEQSPVRCEEKAALCAAPDASAQASFLELKQELRGDIRSLNGRMAALESQLAEMLRLLKSRKSSGSFFETSRPPSPDSDGDSFS